jgi:putative salt-induced outer membrane protein YdiY
MTGIVSTAHASNADAKTKKTWDVSSEVGAIITSGNTKTTTLKGGLKAKHNLENWHNEYKLNAIYKEDEIENDAGERVTERTNEKYSISTQGNYKLEEDHSHLFIYGSYVSDYFGAYRNETVISVGYGLRLLNSEDMYLNAEVGPGIKRFEHQNSSSALDENGNPLAGTSENETIGVAKLDFNWQISENARFTQLLAMEYGDSNTKTTSESALMTKINGSLQMKVAYNVIHNSDVAAEKDNTDTETSLTLVYSF